jgi:hypothetical protein
VQIREDEDKNKLLSIQYESLGAFFDTVNICIIYKKKPFARIYC